MSLTSVSLTNCSSSVSLSAGGLWRSGLQAAVCELVLGFRVVQRSWQAGRLLEEANISSEALGGAAEDDSANKRLRGDEHGGTARVSRGSVRGMKALYISSYMRVCVCTQAYTFNNK